MSNETEKHEEQMQSYRARMILVSQLEAEAEFKRRFEKFLSTELYK